MTLFLPIHCQAVATTFGHRFKYHNKVPLAVPQLVFPPVAATMRQRGCQRLRELWGLQSMMTYDSDRIPLLSIHCCVRVCLCARVCICVIYMAKDQHRTMYEHVVSVRAHVCWYAVQGSRAA